jgi:hypothetical protein
MTGNFKIGDIVRIKKKKHGLDLFYSFGQKHYRRFHIGEIGRIFHIQEDVARDEPFVYSNKNMSHLNRYLPVRFDIIKIWVYHKGGNPSICRCLEDELERASKIESEKYEEADEKHNARIIAEKL